jgi:predicted  nucleic acid-binding Zn-ribbon protein
MDINTKKIIKGYQFRVASLRKYVKSANKRIFNLIKLLSLAETNKELRRLQKKIENIEKHVDTALDHIGEYETKIKTIRGKSNETNEK